MEKPEIFSEAAAGVMSQIQNLTDQISHLRDEIAQITATLGKTKEDIKDSGFSGDSPLAALDEQTEPYGAKISGNTPPPLSECKHPYFNTAGSSSIIIPFPEGDLRSPRPGRCQVSADAAPAACGVPLSPRRWNSPPGSASARVLPRSSLVPVPLLAKPGKLLPAGIPDYRPLLQRDGLILLAWDKRMTEMGDRFTAYWVTSTGTPRFYASKALASGEFCSARPDHKSYAAEDGIEFYGQDVPAYIVHVAPELMRSNPCHVELRMDHIEVLKRQGNKVDFNYKYLLTAEKNSRRMPPAKPREGGHQRAGA